MNQKKELKAVTKEALKAVGKDLMIALSIGLSVQSIVKQVKQYLKNLDK